jgi:transcriptional regulator with XRE-family HTH domain
MGLNHGALTNWDKRGTIPSADVAIRMAEYLGVSVHWLITGVDKEGLSADEHNLVVKYRCLDGQGQFEIRALLDAKLAVGKEQPQGVEEGFSGENQRHA